MNNEIYIFKDVFESFKKITNNPNMESKINDVVKDSQQNIFQSRFYRKKLKWLYEPIANF